MGDTSRTIKTLVVDGTNILVRGIKAMEAHGATLSSHGVSTGPLMVFINSMSRYVREENPDRVVVCWDGGRSTYRTGVYAAYKAARHERSGDETAHFALAKEFLSLANIHHIERAGVEADDLVASYCRQSEVNERVVILSGDKDFLQLLNGWTEQIRPGSNNERWTANRVRSELGCKPEHLPMVMALTGDSGDGVPGVPGFGQKTAVKALSEHDWNLTSLLNTNEAKWAKKIAGHYDQVAIALSLVDLRNDHIGIQVPLAPKFNPTLPPSLLGRELLEFLEHWEMSSIIPRFIGGTLWASVEGLADSHLMR